MAENAGIHNRQGISIFFVVPSYLLMLVPILIIFKESLTAAEPAAKRFWVLAPVMAYVLNFRLHHFLKSAYRVEIGEHGLIIVGITGRKTFVPGNTIIQLCQYRLNKYDCVMTWYSGKRKHTVLLNSDLSDFGELLEAILKMASNIQKVSLGTLVSIIDRGEPIWKKEPDWEIIAIAAKVAGEYQIQKK